MAHPLRSASIIAITSLALTVVSTAISVYVFDQFEPGWGRDRSWQALFGLGLGSAVLSLVGGLFGSIFASRQDRTLAPIHAALAGVLTTVLLLTLLFLKREFAFEGGLFGAVVGSVMLPFIVSLKLSRHDDASSARSSG